MILHELLKLIPADVDIIITNQAKATRTLYSPMELKSVKDVSILLSEVCVVAPHCENIISIHIRK